MVKYDLIKVSLVKYGQNLNMATQIWGADYHKSNQQLLVYASFPWLQLANLLMAERAVKGKLLGFADLKQSIVLSAILRKGSA